MRQSPSCPICHTKVHLHSFYDGITSWEFPGSFYYVQCSKCGLVFQSPREDITHIAKYYKPSSYWGLDISHKFSFPHFRTERQKHYGPVYAAIFKQKPTGSILDIGSGLGLFLSLFREKGWQVLGTETAGDVARFSEKTFQVPVKIGDLENLSLPKKHYDVISMIGVLEHIYTPETTLRKIKSLLKPDGLLVVVPPNINSLGHWIFRRHWYSLDPGRHLYHYSPQTITALLKLHGFEVQTINHNHWEYNYYSLFINCRFLFSPRFHEANNNSGPPAPRKSKSLVIELGKILAKIFAFTGSLLEPVLNMGESMIVIAKPTS